jgi:anti-sigma B factor antagonist
MSQAKPPKHFTLDSERHGDTVFVRLGGEFDLAAEEHFDRMLDGLADQARTIVVDLSALTFIDSSGLRALLRLWQRARTDSFDMTVVQGSDQIRHTMKLTGVDAVLPLVEEAPVPPTVLAADDSDSAVAPSGSAPAGA